MLLSSLAIVAILAHSSVLFSRHCASPLLISCSSFFSSLLRVPVPEQMLQLLTKLPPFITAVYAPELCSDFDVNRSQEEVDALQPHIFSLGQSRAMFLSLSNFFTLLLLCSAQCLQGGHR
jgi:hypothetical protein